MENPGVPHKHPFLDSDKWPKIDKYLNDAENDWLVLDMLDNFYEQFELNAEQKQYV